MLKYQQGIAGQEMKDWDWLIAVIILVIWIVLQFIVFPKLGIPS
jgi:hypothetical protein